ncbi:MAG TPA: phosphate signaling complex protein PhoU [candidate division Zixibacteria bacterium]|nr:phosphate signaling complex protein PhoU [candidate division Zixibacteria bacterium]
MTKHYQKEIDKLKKQLLHLTASVEERVQAAVSSVTEGDVKLAREVIEGDHEIDLMEVELEEELLKILALHQPVAIDLRFIVAALKINSDLERIGDLAVNIAERASQLRDFNVRSAPFRLEEMLGLVVAMVKGSTDALINMDADLARTICDTDDQVDEVHREAYRNTLVRIVDTPDQADYYISLVSISRNLERIADHATNIAEDVIYMVEGEIVRHQGGMLNGQ